MYPGLLSRILATLMDIGVVVLVISFITQHLIPNEATWLKVASGGAVAMLYEPLLTAYACTLGQLAMGTRVRHFESLSRVDLPMAFLRFVTKYVVGIVAGAVNAQREDRRANHDLVANTIVVGAGDA